MLKWSRVQVRIERACPENISKIVSAQYIVDRFYGQSPAMLKALSHYQSKGSVVLNRLTWCEAVLQRFPSELLSEEIFLKVVFLSLKTLFRFVSNVQVTLLLLWAYCLSQVL